MVCSVQFSNFKMIINLYIVHGFSLKWAHFDQEAIGYLSTPSESPVIELPNACFGFEIGHS